MATIPPFLLRHRVTVEPYLGAWGSFGAGVPVRCFVATSVGSGSPVGSEKISSATLYAAPGTVLAAGSRVTLPDGRIGYIAAVAPFQAGGWPTPDHVQAAVSVGSTYGPAFGETVVLLRRTVNGTDRYGSDVYSSAEVTIAGVAVRPLGSQEHIGERREQLTDSVEVILPPGTAVAATDRIRVRGLTYEVDGTPDPRYSAETGTLPGVRVVARRVTG